MPRNDDDDRGPYCPKCGWNLHGGYGYPMWCGNPECPTNASALEQLAFGVKTRILV